MSVDLISTLTASVLSGSVIATFFTAKFNDKSAIHNESVWREKLFELSKKTKLNREDIELFRTCVSATRGIPYRDNYYKYDPYFKRNTSKDIDDLCIVYYYYLIDIFNSNNEIKKIYSSDHNVYLIDSENDILVFRQLCRLLVKTDWNTRTSINFLNCDTDYNHTYRKASVILRRHFLINKPFCHFIKKCYYIPGLYSCDNDKYFIHSDYNDYTKINFKKYKACFIKILYILFSLYAFLLFAYFLNYIKTGVYSYTDLLYFNCLWKTTCSLVFKYFSIIILLFLILFFAMEIIIYFYVIRKKMFPSK